MIFVVNSGLNNKRKHDNKNENFDKRLMNEQFVKPTRACLDWRLLFSLSNHKLIH